MAESALPLPDPVTFSATPENGERVALAMQKGVAKVVASEGNKMTALVN
jgi:hypothetical protein